MKLSVIIPVYNEVESIQVILERVQAQKLAHEIIVVDDGSKDGTRDVLAKLDGKKSVRVILHEHNKGKGAAVRTGMAAAIGDVLLIQDADLEYDPRDYPTLLKPLERGHCRCGLWLALPGRIAPRDHVLAHGCQPNADLHDEHPL